jgi:hypothetical protein
MPRPQREPPLADQAPSGEILTPYDNDHLVTHLRLLDAAAEGADWTEVARIVLGMDPEREPERARASWESQPAARQVADRDRSAGMGRRTFPSIIRAGRQPLLQARGSMACG